ncbi:hypothetical protein [Tsuneonella amylolytica]|uniref:hypothetical protein n=1 Tax=Tsuneonella amylolytica TaxID=2338327 RepID=UPI0013C3FB8D|nr:hypothetical protein [Tsuneonella amylolytica]
MTHERFVPNVAQSQISRENAVTERCGVVLATTGAQVRQRQRQRKRMLFRNGPAPNQRTQFLAATGMNSVPTTGFAGEKAQTLTFRHFDAICKEVNDGAPFGISDFPSKLDDLASRCEGDNPPVDTLRGLCEILRQIGPNLAGFDRDRIDGSFDRLLDAGADESAAALLAGDVFGYMMSRSPGGIAIASAWIPDRSEEHTVQAADHTSALCGAMARACAQAITCGPTPASNRIN